MLALLLLRGRRWRRCHCRARCGCDGCAAGWCCAVFGVRISVSGSPIRNLRGVLVVSPHMSWLDVFAIGSVLPGSFVARADMFPAGSSGSSAEDHPDRTGQSAPAARGGGHRRGPAGYGSDRGGLSGGHHVVRRGLRFLLPGDVPGRDRRGPPGAATPADLPPRQRPISTAPAFVGDDTLWRSICRLCSRRTLAHVHVESLQLPGTDRQSWPAAASPRWASESPRAQVNGHVLVA